MELNYYFMPVLLLSIYYFFKSKDKLFNMLLITSAFTATSILNISSKSFTISFFVGGLYILRTLIDIFLLKVKINKNYINKGIILFLFICLISIVFSFRIDDNFQIISIKSIRKEFERDILNSALHFIYLLYCYFVYLSVKINFYQEKELYSNKITEVKKYCYITLTIVIFISIYYYLDILSFIKTGEYFLKFNDIFRMNPVRLLQGIRLPGPNLEPSMFAIFLLTYFFILFENKKAIIFIFILGICSTSSSFIVGIELIFIYLFLIGNKKERVNVIKIGILFLIILLILVLTIPQIKELLLEIIDKIQGQNVSGSVRKETFLLMLNVFIKYPILGIGYATTRSTDLLSTWLANMGVLGLGSFFYGIYISSKRVCKENKNFYRALIIYWIIAFISVPEPYFIYIWIIWGIIDSSLEKK